MYTFDLASVLGNKLRIEEVGLNDSLKLSEFLFIFWLPLELFFWSLRHFNDLSSVSSAIAGSLSAAPALILPLPFEVTEHD